MNGGSNTRNRFTRDSYEEGSREWSGMLSFRWCGGKVVPEETTLRGSTIVVE